MITVAFQIFLLIGIVALTYVTVIHKLLISRQFSDKYYKNFGLAILGFAVSASAIVSFWSGLESRTLLLVIKSEEQTLEEAGKLFNNLLMTQNRQSLYLIACIVLYGLMLLLLKSIYKDIKKDFDKPKYRWNKIGEKSTNI
ncbi:MAG: hypothetical protein K0R84_760 [Clostridia bacterium]|jgi:hypothetical protein|nr:hypothetical protein [Clostridia bacterium]